jgi:CHASE2 domain-containing sensor protein
MTDRLQGRAPDQEGAAWFPFTVLFGCTIALVMLFFVPAAAPALLRLEHWAADWRTAFLSDRLATAHPGIAIITITEESLVPYPYILPINRGYIADLVTAADQAGARAIGLDFFFTRNTEPDADAKLIGALQKAGSKVVLGVFEDPRRKAQLDYQYDFIAKTGVTAGYIDLLTDRDHVIRYRTSPRPGSRYLESWSAQMAKPLGWSGGAPPERIAWLLPPRDGGPTFRKISAHAFLQASPQQRSEMLNGRVVLIGGELFSLDRHYTPLSLSTGTGMLGVELHAHMAAELIDRSRSYSEVDPLHARIFLAGLAFLGIVLGLRLQRRRFDYLDWRVVSLAVIALDLVMFRFAHIILPFTLAAVAWIAGVTAGTQLRQAVAWSRARWSGVR